MYSSLHLALLSQHQSVVYITYSPLSLRFCHLIQCFCHLNFIQLVTRCVYRLPGVVYLTCSTCNLFSLISVVSFFMYVQMNKLKLKGKPGPVGVMCASPKRALTSLNHIFIFSRHSQFLSHSRKDFLDDEPEPDLDRNLKTEPWT